MFISPFLLGADSFVLGLVLGPSLRRGHAGRLALTLGACDGLAIVAGRALGPLPLGGVAGPALVAAYGMAVLLCARLGRDLRLGGWCLWALPFLLSLDNLVAGAGIVGAVWPTAVAALLAALASSLLGLTGLVLGRLGSPLPGWARGAALVGGALLLALA